LSHAERERIATALGLETLARLFPDIFDRAYRDAQALHAQAPSPRSAYDEPAHLFRAEPGGGR
jgi:hypothetical protein